nr:MAG TPA: ATP-dependent zinc metalloprotease [Bacteriophage sp.]
MENCIERAREHVSLMRNALQTVFDELNQGQQKKILRNEKVRQIFEAYGVDISSAKEK